MYILAAPCCPRNERYAASVREAFVTGSSPSDFPAEHYERSWANRFQLHDLNDTGRRGLGSCRALPLRTWARCAGSGSVQAPSTPGMLSASLTWRDVPPCPPGVAGLPGHSGGRASVHVRRLNHRARERTLAELTNR